MLIPDKHFDLIIVGAGPAGLTTAIKLWNSGLKIAIFEKSSFPKAKVCGDALSGTVLQILKTFPEHAFEDFLNLQEIIPSWGIRFVAPGGKFIDIPFEQKKDRTNQIPGALLSRFEFEKFLLKQIDKQTNITLITNCKVTDIRPDPELRHIIVSASDQKYSSKMIVGADGANSVVGRILSGNRTDLTRLGLGVRGYFSGIKELQPDNFIELHFLKEILPNYLWIFPMHNGTANVGLGMLSSEIKKSKCSPDVLLLQLIESNPKLRKRFLEASLIGKLETHTLPMGPRKNTISGNHYLLTGDAASLIDPFTGEGIGNAMKSASIAAGIIEKAFRENNFSKENLLDYDREIELRIIKELKVSNIIRKLASSSVLFNFVMRKVQSSDKLKSLLGKMYTDLETRKKLTNPVFYLTMVMDPL